ncbi:MAG TPA: chorismate-binding protein, partial [Flavobacterium sp.]|nr:chorismate-binding protein [Flavobacterium sp.]
SGFVMAPFGEGSKILIPDSFSEEIIVAVTFETVEFGPIPEVESAPADGSSFIELVTKAKAAIDSGDFLKVVVSRKEPISVANFDAVAAFENLVQRYQNAFTYCWFHPKVGMWLGATPEQLVRTDGNRFYSVALAGTRSFTGTTNVKWEVKEQDEQQFVTDYIIESLRPISSEIIVSSPYTSRAGNLLHIKTDVEIVVKDGTDLQTVVAVLHPTPAVCGVPKSAAMDFIRNNEVHAREFYSGFLGEVNRDGKSDLFVNLRCMKFEQDDTALFVGCGITKDSDAEKEYLETVHKSMTLKRIII